VLDWDVSLRIDLSFAFFLFSVAAVVVSATSFDSATCTTTDLDRLVSTSAAVTKSFFRLFLSSRRSLISCSCRSFSFCFLLQRMTSQQSQMVKIKPSINDVGFHDTSTSRRHYHPQGLAQFKHEKPGCQPKVVLPACLVGGLLIGPRPIKLQLNFRFERLKFNF
jgi:hypothetical protein